MQDYVIVTNRKPYLACLITGLYMKIPSRLQQCSRDELLQQTYRLSQELELVHRKAREGTGYKYKNYLKPKRKTTRQILNRSQLSYRHLDAATQSPIVASQYIKIRGTYMPIFLQSETTQKVMLIPILSKAKLRN